MSQIQRELAATKVKVFSTGEGFMILQTQNGKARVDAYLGIDEARKLAQSIFQTAQKEFFAVMAKKGSHVGKL